MAFPQGNRKRDESPFTISPLREEDFLTELFRREVEETSPSSRVGGPLYAAVRRQIVQGHCPPLIEILDAALEIVSNGASHEDAASSNNEGNHGEK
eukprot:CAMPEP_0178732256 /NCGR_PEP_ID=MMETSP0744-20121128/164_1 /TAXON_ID=913974 /ORGANISM="Nitzschia punctata, Strain CCMP561" /LENGTH=95 /DNA_ID=CAMNT_0020384359 /DNA_START=174 /DNA_END=461 /DNA_ORIENTATION=-